MLQGELFYANRNPFFREHSTNPKDFWRGNLTPF